MWFLQSRKASSKSGFEHTATWLGQTISSPGPVSCSVKTANDTSLSYCEECLRIIALPLSGLCVCMRVRASWVLTWEAGPWRVGLGWTGEKTACVSSV